MRQLRDKVHRDGLRATWRSVNARLDDPLPLGYSAAGEVLAVGEGLEGRFQVGDRVAIGGAGSANHAEIDLVPGNLAVKIPGDTPFEEACFATLGAIALHSVRLVRPQLGEWIGVVGTGLVGLLATQFAKLSGARVLALDYDRARLALAAKLGADRTWCLSDGDPAAIAFEASGGLGCDAVIIAAATTGSEPFETAAAIARDRATVALVGITGTAFPYRAFMHKELNIVVARSYGPGRYDSAFERQGMAYPEGYVRWTETQNLQVVVDLLAEERLDVKQLTTHQMPFDDAGKAYQIITSASEPHLGIVLNYTVPEPLTPTIVSFPTPELKPAAGACVLGVIGAGQYARTIVLPRLAVLTGITLHTVSSARGLSAEQARRQFGFRHASSDAEALVNNPEVNALLILTPHSTHAALASQALLAGKSVLVEKPLALSRKELDRVLAARQAAAGFLQVGFNRRLAPLTIKAKAVLDGLESRKHIVIRANAGRPAADAWESEPEHGGGRLLGEACHFIDLAQHLAGCPIVAVQAAAAAPGNGPAEDIGAHLEFADGSLATIAYTAFGDTAYSKELIEIFCNGQVVRIDNFRELTVVRDGKHTRSKGRQDKGHQALLTAFCAAVRAGGPPPLPEEDLFNSSLATIALKDALREGRRIILR
ncbi:MAG: bi-domain-containing oxidoreductase [Alphaproteobacteria bacterium]